jgi:uncharacterized membrane protein YGL010W
VDQYGESHRTPVNRALHFAGIPVLVVASLGLVSKLSLSDEGVPALRPNAAWPLLLAACLWNLRWDWKMGLLSTAVYVGGYALGSTLSAGALWSLFGAGVVAHVIGHYGFEGKPPALFSHPVAVLEATPWLLSLWTGLYR